MSKLSTVIFDKIKNFLKLVGISNINQSFKDPVVDMEVLSSV